MFGFRSSSGGINDSENDRRDDDNDEEDESIGGSGRVEPSTWGDPLSPLRKIPNNKNNQVDVVTTSQLCVITREVGEASSSASFNCVELLTVKLLW